MFINPNPSHPGELLSEILEEHEISQAELARMIGVSKMTISRVARGEAPVSASLAVLFGAAFGQTPELWAGLQRTYDLAAARRELKDRIESVKRIAA